MAALEERLPAVPSGSTEMDLVMRDDSIARNLWKLACIAAAHPDEEGYVRKVKLAVADQSRLQWHEQEALYFLLRQTHSWISSSHVMQRGGPGILSRRAIKTALL